VKHNLSVEIITKEEAEEFKEEIPFTESF